MIDRLLGLFSHNVGIDLGTANTLVFVQGKGIAIREPSFIARHKKTKEILAIGKAAKNMQGKTPQTIEVIRPLKDGVIADFDATAAMLSYYIKKVHQSASFFPKVPRPLVVIGIPSGVTEVERRAVQDAALTSGARQAFLIEEPMAAAIGAGLPVESSAGIFIVDIGGGTTEIAMISLGGIVVERCLRVAGDEIDDAIISYIRMRYSLLIGQATAEDIKIQIGSVAPQNKEKVTVIRGRHLESGLPKSLKVNGGEIREAILPIIQQIVAQIKQTIEEAPPELVADIMERGIGLCGGGSLLPGLDKVIEEDTKMPVWIADDPLTCVVRGCGKVLEDRNLLEKVKISGGLR